MEQEYRLSPMSRLFEARHALREHLALETALIERICELPEDDFCHSSRESFQLGAGYAYLHREDVDASLEDVFAAYFATQPRNRYLDPETVAIERKTVSQAALQLLETGEIPDLEPHIDVYQVEASAAFAEGYLLASSMLRYKTNETGAA